MLTDRLRIHARPTLIQNPPGQAFAARQGSRVFFWSQTRFVSCSTGFGCFSGKNESLRGALGVPLDVMGLYSVQRSLPLLSVKIARSYISAGDVSGPVYPPYRYLALHISTIVYP